MQLVMCLLFFLDGIVHRNCFTELENMTRELIPGEKPSPTMHRNLATFCKLCLNFQGCWLHFRRIAKQLSFVSRECF